jgi:hypothetical protein
VAKHLVASRLVLSSIELVSYYMDIYEVGLGPKLATLCSGPSNDRSSKI